MGINGLLKNTKSVGQRRHISYYRNKTIGIDGYAWMHKAVHSCTMDLVFEQNIKGIINFFTQRLKYLLQLKIKIVLVFDGNELPLKRLTNQGRTDNRAKQKELAQKYLKEGNMEAARKYYAASISINPNMVYSLLLRLKEIFKGELQYIIAPYEADSQLAYLSKIRYIDLVITEDSDLIVFGAEEIFYKMDSNFYGIVYQKSNLKYCEEINLRNWDHQQFIQLCILAGCDYLPSPKGIGFKTAYSLIFKFSNFIEIYQNLKETGIDQYYEKFMCAFIAFKYSRVFCPHKNEIVHLNKFDQALLTQDTFEYHALEISKNFQNGYDFLGLKYTNEQALQIALCQIHPRTLHPFHDKYVVKKKNQNFQIYLNKKPFLNQVIKTTVDQLKKVSLVQKYIKG